MPERARIREILDDLKVSEYDSLREAAYDFSQRPVEEQNVRMWVGAQLAGRERNAMNRKMDEIEKKVDRLVLIPVSAIVTLALAVIYALSGAPLPPPVT